MIALLESWWWTTMNRNPTHSHAYLPLRLLSIKRRRSLRLLICSLSLLPSLLLSSVISIGNERDLSIGTLRTPNKCAKALVYLVSSITTSFHPSILHRPYIFTGIVWFLWLPVDVPSSGAKLRSLSSSNRVGVSTCSICGDDELGSSDSSALSCAHVFCNECWGMLRSCLANVV